LVPIPAPAPIEEVSHSTNAKNLASLNKSHEESEDEQETGEHYEVILHPNDELESVGPTKDNDDGLSFHASNVKKDCAYYFNKLDVEIMKPILIFNYQTEKMDQQDEIMDLMINDQNALNEIYSKLDANKLHSSI
jgi:hypothetical protein